MLIIPPSDSETTDIHRDRQIQDDAIKTIPYLLNHTRINDSMRSTSIGLVI